jgi:hypothetical protein
MDINLANQWMSTVGTSVTALSSPVTTCTREKAAGAPVAANQLSREFESASSKILLPDLAQLHHSNKIAQPLNLSLGNYKTAQASTLSLKSSLFEPPTEGCCFVGGLLYCPCRR